MKKFLILLILTILSISPAYAVKIGLLQDVHKIYFGIATDGQIVDTNLHKQIMPISKLTTYEIKAKRDVIQLRTEDNYKYDIPTDEITIRTVEPNSFICVNNKWYKGSIHIVRKHNDLTVINDVGLEDYVKGVIPAEMPSSWSIEALKAQAIAARSYTIANLGKRADHGFDLTNTTQDQVYYGVSAETPSTNQAVEETEGLVLTHDNKVISTIYCSSAGGMTKSAQEVWGGYVPYLQPVRSFDDSTGKRGHGVGMSQYGAKNLAEMGYNAFQILGYFYTGIHFAKLNPENIN